MRFKTTQTNQKSKKESPGIACLLLFFFFLSFSGCALSEQRAHPEFENRIKTIKQPVLIPPDVTMLELLPSGIVRQRPEWSAAGCRNLEKAIQLQLEDKKCTLKPLRADLYSEHEITEIQALYRLVHKSMKQQTFNSLGDSLAHRRFEFSLGSLDRLLDKMDADAMIFISGYDRVSPAGRKAMIDLAVADSSGTIIYFSIKGTTRGSDLREFASANVIVEGLLAGFSGIEG
jgi:hypothetical protein